MSFTIHGLQQDQLSEIHLAKCKFLWECIQQIYIVKHRASAIPTIPEGQSLLRIMKPQNLSVLQLIMMHIRDKESCKPVSERRTPRKQAEPQKFDCEDIKLLEVSFFAPIRWLIELRDIRKCYNKKIRGMRQVVEKEMRCRRKYSLINWVNKNKNGNFDEQPETIIAKPACSVYADPCVLAVQPSKPNPVYGDTCKRVNVLKHFLTERQYRERMDLNEKVEDEIVRSIYYMKSLMLLLGGCDVEIE